MKHCGLYNFVFWVLLIFTLQVKAQDRTVQNFLGQNVKETIALPPGIGNFYIVGTKYVGLSKNENLSNTITFFSKNGMAIKKKTYNGAITKVQESKYDNILAVGYIYQRSENIEDYEYRADIYDANTNLVSQFKGLSSPNIAISESGTYLMTTGVTDMGAGKIELFNIKNMETVQIPYYKPYTLFSSAFLGDNKLICIFQYDRPFKPINDRSELKRTAEKKKKYPESVDLIVFNIDKKIIESDYDIKSISDGFEITPIMQSLYISPNYTKIILVGSDNSNRNLTLTPKIIFALDMKAQVEWKKIINDEDSNFEGIKDINIVNNNLIVLSKYGLKESQIILLDNNTGNQKWKLNLGPHVDFLFTHVQLTDDNVLLLQSTIDNLTKLESLSIDVEDGNLMDQVENYVSFPGNKKDNLIYNSVTGTMNISSLKSGEIK